MVLLLQELVSVCCSTRAFMVFEMRERKNANLNREDCHNFLHVLRDIGDVENKTRVVGGAYTLALLCI